MSGLARWEAERQERRDLGLEDHWDDPANPDYADCSEDPEPPPEPVRLAKLTDPRCRRRRPVPVWHDCHGQIFDGRCDECGMPPRTQVAR